MQAPNTPGCSLLFRPLSDLMTWKLRQGLLEQLRSRSIKTAQLLASSYRTWNLARGKRDIWIGSDTETKLLEGKLDI